MTDAGSLARRRDLSQCAIATLTDATKTPAQLLTAPRTPSRRLDSYTSHDGLLAEQLNSVYLRGAMTGSSQQRSCHSYNTRYKTDAHCSIIKR